MKTIENDFLKLTVSDHGAELVSLIKKSDGREVIWCGNPKFWNRHAPVLFPFVGKVQGGEYRYNGKSYPMGQHGFARDMEFLPLDITSHSITHRLMSNDETYKKYPFEFVFDETHELCDNAVTVTWKISNPSETEPLYFSVGGHPAFNCPLREGESKSDYYLWFGGKKSLTYFLIDPVSEGVDTENPKTLGLSDGKLKIEESLFDNDALIIDGQLQKLGLLYPDGSPYVTLTCPDALSVGIWSKPKANAPYICLEPWIGRCDNKGFDGELKDKFGEQVIAPGEYFKTSYKIEIN